MFASSADIVRMRSAVCLAALMLYASAAHAETIAGRASVIDGDTLEIHGERIRILDVDAPESKQLGFETGGIDNSHWHCGAFADNKLAD
jgi:endonuclease YncB( thermonuclease family)